MTTREIAQWVEYHRAEGFVSPEELLTFIKLFWRVHIPRAKVCPIHTPPAEDNIHSFFETVQDSVCWANRGGGKTFNGALVTWLDTVFKNNCATKILGSFLEQSKKMYQHLTGGGDGWGLATKNFGHLIKGEMLAGQTTLVNNSSINILTASSKSAPNARYPEKPGTVRCFAGCPARRGGFTRNSIYRSMLSIPKRGQLIITYGSFYRLDFSKKAVIRPKQQVNVISPKGVA